MTQLFEDCTSTTATRVAYANTPAAKYPPAWLLPNPPPAAAAAKAGAIALAPHHPRAVTRQSHLPLRYIWWR